MRKDSFDWLDGTAEQAARRLLGCELVREIDGNKIRVRIVETEAYDQADGASHAFSGQTKRNEAMFMSAGHLYVYFTYGMHYCMNIVCCKEGFGSGALIRAVEPIEGYEIIEKNRGVAGVGVTNGPAKLAQALRIETALSGILRRQSGTDFQRRVWGVLSDIPYGKTISYKELADLAGSPGGVRAAGTACGKNKLVLLIPCHRVLRSDGAVGDYLYGAEIKESLLRHEGTVV